MSLPFASLRRTQRGAGALPAVLLLLLLALIAMGGLGRALWTEQRSVAAQVHGIQSQEAAQFGLDRAWTRLHEPLALSDDCRLAGTPGVSTLERLLRPAADPAFSSTLSSAAAPVLLACARTGNDWDCRCPHDVPAAAAAAAERATGEGVWVQAMPLAARDPGRPAAGWRLTAFGCSEGGAACARDAAFGVSPAAGAVAHLALDLVPRPALAALPAAALVAGGDVRLQGTASAPVRVVNRDPGAHGLVVHAGSRVSAADAQVLGLPGAPQAWAVAEADASLAEGGPAPRLARWLGIEPTRWGAWPRVARLACDHGACDGRQVEALLTAGHRAVHVEGDLDWSAPQGPSDGFVLVVSGTLRIAGHGHLDAVLLAQAIRLQATDPVAPLVVQGAAIAAGDAELVGPVHLQRSASVLEQAGRWPVALGRVSGGWRDLPTP